MKDYCSACGQFQPTLGFRAGSIVVAHVSKGKPCLDRSPTTGTCYTRLFIKEDADKFSGGDVSRWQRENFEAMEL